MADNTERGFRIDRFKDAYDVECSLQESSILAEEGHVWFGCNDPNLTELVPGKGHVPVKGLDHLGSTTRMHLSQSQVRDLLPALQHFAEHGVLPSS